MTILHVTDFHFNKRWFDWLVQSAPPHDLLVMSGDMLNLAIDTPQRKQIEWVSEWIESYPRPMCICSGNHDLEWDADAEHWKPAYWLRDLVNPNVCIDGQRVEFDGLSLLNIGRTTRPKGGAADIWVVHVPPSKTIVATRSNGRDNGDPELVSAVRRYAPRMVLSGHIHTPIHWREQSDSTLYLNPGRSPDAAFPNYILISTELMSGKLYTAQRHEASIEAAAIRAPDEEACVTTAVA